MDRSGEQGRCGMTTMSFSVTNCHLEEDVSSRIVIQQPTVVVPWFQSFSLHVLSQEPQAVTVKVRNHCAARSNKFSVNLTLKKIMSMVSVAVWTCHAFFGLGDYSSSSATNVFCI